MISLDLSYRGQEAQKANPHRGAFGAKCPVAPRSSAASSTISRAPPSSSLTRSSSSSSSTTRSSPPRSSTRPPSPSPVAAPQPQPSPSPAKAAPRSRSPTSNSSLRRSTGGPYIPSSLAPDSIYDTDEDEDGMAPYKLPPSVDPLIALSLAPYDTCDPEIAQYCTLPTPPNSLPRSSPFSRSNSPLPVNGDLLSSLPSVQDSIVAPPVLKTPAIAAAFVDFEAYGRQALFDFNQKALRTTQIISDFTASPESQSMSRENRARLTFLKDTVDLFVTYLGRQAQATAQIRAYVSLLDAAAEQMDQTFLMISKILGGETVMTPNFDIFELTLRRYQEQLARMFPAGDAQQVVARPSMLIQDARAKTIWEEAFGPSCWFVSFATFIAEIVDKQFLSRAPESLNRDTFVLFLRYFLNFPVDDMVTTYKWNALMQLFGPPDSFLSNFSAYGLGQGFLGLTNRINAYEILSVKPESRIVLIRLSRTEPEFLAFSYKNSRGEIGHQVNKGPDGRAIPIKRFLEHKFPGYALVSERLDIASILGKSLDSTLCDYANASQDYIL